MMDLKEWSSSELKENKKCCADCKTTRTPLWRGGPAGPKAQQHPFLFHFSISPPCGLWAELLIYLFVVDADAVQRLWNQVPEEKELFQEERGGGGVAAADIILCCEETEVEDVGRRGTSGCVFDGLVLWFCFRLNSNHSFTYHIPGSMIFSLLHLPRCRIPRLTNYWGETFHSFSTTCGNNSSIRPIGYRIYGLQGEQRKKWTRPITTNAEGKGNIKSKSIKQKILSETILAGATVGVNKTQLDQFQENQYCDIQQEIAQNKDLSSLVTVIVFDIETTGLSRENERIIEIALRDLQGGENSTFQTLVNPQCKVPNSRIHGITTQMVNKPDVPRMEDLIPILLQYVRSREKPGGHVLLVAHNARCFDVPFIMNELRRHSMKMPPNWLFLDSLALGRELLKSGETELSSTSLAALRDLYGIKVDGSAHRAMVDVNTLSLILPRLTCDLKLTLSDLVKKSFKESDIINSKKKKNLD
ncbi:unnamed protein product [Sphenostylis stenocarpa]|uniref:GATA-type domain-containing protein n=1 Tax=Sphenostylis stenocarpa TaxID=92480 RepID=A0AA86V6P4_9FABA|nr:unnamed protein product [Sphenostylis stenocarpa]